MDSDDRTQNQDAKVSVTELEVTWDRVIRVWWSYLWRKFIVALAAMIASAMIGLFFGVIIHRLGVSNHATARWVILPIGFAIGLGFSVIPIKLILGKNFGTFRLVLVSTQANAQNRASPCGIAS